SDPCPAPRTIRRNRDHPYRSVRPRGDRPRPGTLPRAISQHGVTRLDSPVTSSVSALLWLRSERKTVAVRADRAFHDSARPRSLAHRARDELNAIIAVLSRVRLVLILDVRPGLLRGN